MSELKKAVKILRDMPPIPDDKIVGGEILRQAILNAEELGETKFDMSQPPIVSKDSNGKELTIKVSPENIQHHIENNGFTNPISEAEAAIWFAAFADKKTAKAPAKATESTENNEIRIIRKRIAGLQDLLEDTDGDDARIVQKRIKGLEELLEDLSNE